VYSGNSLNPLTVVALDPADGSTLWANNYDWLGAEILPVLPPAPPFFTGQPTARFNSVVSISAEKIWVVLGVGYQFYNPNTGRFSNQVRVTLLVSLDPADGSVIGYTALRDTNEGLISIGSDGSLTVSHGSSPTMAFRRPTWPPARRWPASRGWARFRTWTTPSRASSGWAR
jgi:hypothetical protein